MCGVTNWVERTTAEAWLVVDASTHDLPFRDGCYVLLINLVTRLSHSSLKLHLSQPWDRLAP